MMRGEKFRERVVGDEEFEKYVLCAKPLLADVATVLHDTGLRPAECRCLDWSDIAFVNGRLGKLRVSLRQDGRCQARTPDDCPRQTSPRIALAGC